MSEVPKTEDEFKGKLDPEAYNVLRQGGTEAPYSGEYVHTKEAGMYKCKACGNELFDSGKKYDGESGPEGLRGWPSFTDALPGAVVFLEDNTLGMHRTEVRCSRCNSHLGHIFDDESALTGKHYCINSVCLDLEKN